MSSGFKLAAFLKIQEKYSPFCNYLPFSSLSWCWLLLICFSYHFVSTYFRTPHFP